MKLTLDGYRVELYMTQRGLNNRKMAEITGLSNSVISRARNGQHVNVRTAYHIAKALDVKINDLLDEPIDGLDY